MSDGTGGAIVTWSDARDGAADIYAQHILASGAIDGNWPANGRALCSALDDQSAPASVSDGAGGAIVTWHDRRNGTTFDIYAQHVLASGAVDGAWPADGRALCTAVNQQFFPAIASDGAAGAIVTWSDSRAGTTYDIYAQHVLASGSVDAAWPANGRALCVAAGNQFAPGIARDGAGGAIVSWSDARSGVDYDIYAQHVLASGVIDPAWPSGGRGLCAAPNDQSDAIIVSDGSGGALVAWDDLRNGTDYDIYTDHVQSSGTVDPAWPVDGRALCTATDDQFSPQIAVSTSGSVIVTWEDLRSGVDYDVYAQRVLATGAVDPGWPSDGRALCVATGDQFSPMAAVDGTGGAIVTWYDQRAGTSFDIFAQHVLSSGVTDAAWGTGRPICIAAGDQLSPVIVPDGSGGAIIAWYDQRSGTNYDIYAQHIVAGGGVVAVAPAGLTTLTLRAPQPNPARGQSAITFDLPAAQRITLELLDLAGRRVRVLVADEEVSPGSHTILWDGADDSGRVLRSGMYFARMLAGGRSFARRLTVLR